MFIQKKQTNNSFQIRENILQFEVKNEIFHSASTKIKKTYNDH